VRKYNAVVTRTPNVVVTRVWLHRGYNEDSSCNVVTTWLQRFHEADDQLSLAGTPPRSEQIGNKNNPRPMHPFRCPPPKACFQCPPLIPFLCSKAGRIFTRRASEGALSKALLEGCFRRLPPKARFSKAPFFKALLPRHAWRRDPKDRYR